jgi:uncharacterized protein (TIGR02996 family)
VPHDDAFLQAIIENPDDDAPRLIYADWLDERGACDRAEFIRVQCDLARLPDDDKRWVELNVRERELLTCHEGEWATDVLRPLTGMVNRWRFCRGFIENVTLEARGLQTHADVLFGRAPIRELSVYLAGRRIHHLMALQHLTRLTKLDCSGNSLSDAAVRCIVASPFLGRLTKLGLRYNRIGDDGAVAIAACPHLPCLRKLELTVNNIGDAGALALARSEQFPNLVYLDLNANPIDRGARAVLRERFGDGVSTSQPVVRGRTRRNQRA